MSRGLPGRKPPTRNFSSFLGCENNNECNAVAPKVIQMNGDDRKFLIGVKITGAMWWIILVEYSPGSDDLRRVFSLDGSEGTPLAREAGQGRAD